MDHLRNSLAGKARFVSRTGILHVVPQFYLMTRFDNMNMIVGQPGDSSVISNYHAVDWHCCLMDFELGNGVEARWLARSRMGPAFIPITDPVSVGQTRVRCDKPYAGSWSYSCRDAHERESAAGSNVQAATKTRVVRSTQPNNGPSPQSTCA